MPQAIEAENIEGVSDGDRHKLVRADSIRHSFSQINIGDILSKQPYWYSRRASDVGSLQKITAAEEVRCPQQLDPSLRQSER